MEKVTFEEFYNSFRRYANATEFALGREYHGWESAEDTGIFDCAGYTWSDIAIWANRWGDYYWEHKGNEEDSECKYQVILCRSEFNGHADCREALARWSHDDGHVEIEDCPEVEII